MDITIPRPDASSFTTNIDNPFLTLRPGTSFVYESKDAGSTDVFTVLRQTKVVDGVTCVVVHDVAYENGLVVEDTFDWFAQDDAGNVWYFGEFSRSYEAGNPVPIDTHGSWETGVNGAQPGIVMLANPHVGDTYDQEFAPGIAEDFAQVLALNAITNVGYGSFGGTLKTKDVNPLDPSTENKYYAAGVGNLLTTNADGEREELTRIIVNGTAGNDSLPGYAGGDEMRGRGGNDNMNGGTGNDTMHGGAGNDAIRGGGGHDDLSGGGGNDWLKGGPGADSFIFRSGHNGTIETDTITHYSRDALDVIDLFGGTASIASETQVGEVWQLTLKGDGDIIRLIGVSDQNNDGHIIDDLLIV